MGWRVLPEGYRSQGHRQVILFVTRILLLAFLCVSCVERQKTPPGALVIAIESGPRTLDPRLATDATSVKIFDLIYNGLVKRNDDTSIGPDLAISWELATPLQYRLNLRRNVKFHNGKEFTSADVIAQYKFLIDPANKSPHRSSMLMVESVEAPDDYTVVYNLRQPNAPFLGNLTMGIVPSGSGKEITENPVGTGFFKLAEYSRDEKLLLTANGAYFDGPPKLNSLLFRIIPDETVRTLELESGSVHLIMNPITPDLLPRLAKNEQLKVFKKLGTNYSYLGFNLEDELVGRHDIRLAIAHAIDRESVVRYILKGLAKPATGPLSVANRFYEPDVETYEYDPEKAKSILDEAGFPDPDGDGPKVRFRVEYSTSRNELRKRIAEVFQWQLQKVGIGLDIRSYEWGTFYANIKKGRFQLFSLTWVGISDPDIFHYIFHSASFPPGGANRGRYISGEIDKLLDKGRVVTGKERESAYAKAQKIIASDIPYVSLWHSVNVAVSDRKVTGFTVAPDESLGSLHTTRIKR